MNNQEILGMDSANAAAKEMPYRSNMTISAALVIEMVKRITDLEAYLQKVQADRVNDIAIERKRWAKADLVALEILRLEQQIKGVNDFANKFCGDCKTLEQAAVSYCAESFIKSLKEPRT
tara:strand:- start:50 stop:409 length:360 start_codon:yes stop_codon:yes gene_type:complete